MYPKVSIITVCYNSDVTLCDTIESVLEQDYRNIEYIIVDGGSTDNTIDIINEYRDKIDVVISEPDKGIYDAMNRGINVATGDLVCILNSDDLYSSTSSVRRLVECGQKAGTDTVFADLVFVDPSDTDQIVRYYRSNRFHPKRLRYGWMPAHPTFVVKRELYQKWGLYLLDYRIAADYEMMVRLLYRAGATYTYLPEVVVKMRAGGVSTSGLRSSWVLNREIVRACRENSLKTNMFRLLLKIPAKLMERVRKPRLG